MTFSYSLILYADRLADYTIIAWSFWNTSIVYQFCVFVHAKLFDYVFKFSMYVVCRNVMSVFKIIYVSMLRIVG